nr:hypothetical protein [Tanacetum cinerariifolium]
MSLRKSVFTSPLTRGRGVNEKDVNASNIGAVMNDAIPSATVVAGNTQEENVSHVVDMTVEKDKLSSLEDNTVQGSFPPLPTSSTRLFSFQFTSMDGLDAMLENCPWFIRNNPLILKKWHPDENLLKKDVSIVPVCVKLHGVPVTAFTGDGLSAIPTKLGTPLMFVFYTSDMCMQSLGRSSYARVMIEL